MLWKKNCQNSEPIAAGDTIENQVFSYNNDCIHVDGAANVISFPCGNTDNQIFALIYVTADTFLLQAKHSGKCLYIQGASDDNGANVQQLACRNNGDTSEVCRKVDQQG
jgi:hypothetical protein